MPVSLLKVILAEPDTKKDKKKEKPWMKKKTIKSSSLALNRLGSRRQSKQTGTSILTSSRRGTTSVSGTQKSSMNDEEEDEDEDFTSPKGQTTRRSGLTS